MDSWKEIAIDNKKYLISTFNNKNQWKIMLTDFRELFTELLSMEKITNQCQELNPLLSIEDFDITSIVEDLLTNLPEFLSEKSSTSRLELTKKIEGGIFKFVVDLKACKDSDEFFEVITRPLCLGIVELKRENDIIIHEIIKKDDEIREIERTNDIYFRLHKRTRVFYRSHLPPVKSNYDQDELYRSFENFFHENGGLFRKVYVKDDDSVGENEEQLENPDDTNQLEENNEIEKSVKISDENNENNSTDNHKNKVVENPEAEKDVQKNPKRPSGLKPDLRSSKRIKKKLSDFIS
ncbi:uncharacterized protein LOC123262628 isoform X2 [Cotesia glomerata]|uniref:uncharacterized protein LOC123262628 isoform X2 n=1 Tax=Cotesia glomerata TaxID=32391 RepID=UPI001D015EB2|nr:uncharacterized protein LOC123262628 isoform X2 [Cotesia glomerata]